MAQLTAYFKLRSVVAGSNPVTPEEFITFYIKQHINWCLNPTEPKIAQWLLSFKNHVEDFIAWFKVTPSKMLQPYLLQM